MGVSMGFQIRIPKIPFCRFHLILSKLVEKSVFRFCASVSLGPPLLHFFHLLAVLFLLYQTLSLDAVSEVNVMVFYWINTHFHLFVCWFVSKYSTLRIPLALLILHYTSCAVCSVSNGILSYCFISVAVLTILLPWSFWKMFSNAEQYKKVHFDRTYGLQR